MSMQTLEQRRAKHALDRIKELESSGSFGNYVSYVNALPAAILMNGLGQALATECAASDKAHSTLAHHLADWLLSAEAHSPYHDRDGGPNTPKRLLDGIVAGDQHAYLWAQGEAIAYLSWLKKFANAFLKHPGQSNGG